MGPKSKPIAWVDIVPQNEASGDLASAYDAVKGADGRVENLYLAMSQTPTAIKPADDHYKALLHNPDNPLEPWLAELLSTYVAILCGCEYAIANHGENFRYYLNDPERADKILDALRDETWPKVLTDSATRTAIAYARKLSFTPREMTSQDIQELRRAGYCDKSISYIIQLVASFAYWTRMINALGTQVGDTVGLSNRAAPRHS